MIAVALLALGVTLVYLTRAGFHRAAWAWCTARGAVALSALSEADMARDRAAITHARVEAEQEGRRLRIELAQVEARAQVLRRMERDAPAAAPSRRAPLRVVGS